MDVILQVSEIVGLKYPDYLTVFLDNCLEEFQNNFFSHDYLFALIYMIIMSGGFSPIDFYDEHHELCTPSFNIKKMRQITSYKKGYVKLCKISKYTYLLYKIPIKYGHYRPVCELQAVPSAKDNDFLIVNIVEKSMGLVKSVSVCLKEYLESNPAGTKYKFTFKNIRELEIFIKDNVSNCIREEILMKEESGISPSLLGLPEMVQEKIMYKLCENPASVQALSSTCSYFRRMTKYDSQLWQRCLNFSYIDSFSYMTVLFQYGNDDSSVFKRLFLGLQQNYQKDSPSICAFRGKRNRKRRNRRKVLTDNANDEV